mmetsp:Transcript_669/g.1944  ORF Transcript_669/g.1944 Transcript_669/m.1944 type:complete len:290 (+) Transcript_669:907-1776(+)
MAFSFFMAGSFFRYRLLVTATLSRLWCIQRSMASAQVAVVQSSSSRYPFTFTNITSNGFRLTPSKLFSLYGFSPALQLAKAGSRQSTPAYRSMRQSRLYPALKIALLAPISLFHTASPSVAWHLKTLPSFCKTSSPTWSVATAYDCTCTERRSLLGSPGFCAGSQLIVLPTNLTSPINLAVKARLQCTPAGQKAGRNGPRILLFMNMKYLYFLDSICFSLNSHAMVPQSKHMFSWCTYLALLGSRGSSPLSLNPTPCCTAMMYSQLSPSRMPWRTKNSRLCSYSGSLLL